ncbi:hypothetical protein EUTSA_v10014870mg [Eutrema salsugineum]|uniref:NYN domain-containing protein n=1 Tax=Eutrema salsugineum TaxID=72664 RepID=V4NB17_EUTSA|nr:hypothetical protein EUTSA_v10014870mg [Eutrema salsugineum]
MPGFVKDNITYVLWNLEDYPVSDGADLGSIRRNIEEALDLMGIHGSMDILAFGDQLKSPRAELSELGIDNFLPEPLSGNNSAAFKLPAQMIGCSGEGSRVWVIAKQQGPGSELYRVQQCLASRNYTILVIDDDDTTGVSPVDSVQSLFKRTRSFGGGKPQEVGLY